MLDECWATVADGGLAFKQNWINVSRLSMHQSIIVNPTLLDVDNNVPYDKSGGVYCRPQRE